MTYSPKLALCNFFPDTKILKQFALEHGFQGIDWTFNRENLPRTRVEELRLAKNISTLHPLEVRYHLFFTDTDLGDVDAHKAKNAARLLHHACRLISRLRGRRITVHVGLGRDSSSGLCWQTTVEGLADLTRFAAGMGIRVCLENLVRGWTSRPALFEKILVKSGCCATLDIGHARCSASVRNGSYRIEDFVLAHPDRFLNAHIYHEETMQGHQPPVTSADIEDRLRLLSRLPFCDWWVLELREEKALLQTLRAVREFLQTEARSIATSRAARY
ncbi:MAG: sugar phosphate isomerase/epimerase [Desulfomonile tiedjei]|nr:sugar phosphate isomerase/epimerase [Desulfomonile tiedjei]